MGLWRVHHWLVALPVRFWRMFAGPIGIPTASWQWCTMPMGGTAWSIPLARLFTKAAAGSPTFASLPRGDKIAFMDHPARWDDRGSVCVVDLAGHETTLSSGWGSEDGLAW